MAIELVARWNGSGEKIAVVEHTARAMPGAGPAVATIAITEVTWDNPDLVSSYSIQTGVAIAQYYFSDLVGVGSVIAPLLRVQLPSFAVIGEAMHDARVKFSLRLSTWKPRRVPDFELTPMAPVFRKLTGHCRESPVSS